MKIATAVTKLSELMASGSWIMLLNLPGGSTLQWGEVCCAFTVCFWYQLTDHLEKWRLQNDCICVSRTNGRYKLVDFDGGSWMCEGYCVSCLSDL